MNVINLSLSIPSNKCSEMQQNNLVTRDYFILQEGGDFGGLLGFHKGVLYQKRFDLATTEFEMILRPSFFSSYHRSVLEKQG